MRLTFSLILLFLLASAGLRPLISEPFRLGLSSDLMGSALDSGLRPHGPYLRETSVDDLKRSEEYLKKDLGLPEFEKNPGDPLWMRSLEAHPLIVAVSAFMFLGGLSGFFWYLRKQSRELDEGLKLSRENAAIYRGGGGETVPASVQELIYREEKELQSLPSLPQEKIPRKVDTVLDSLRYSLRSGARNSRISLFRYDEIDHQFRICGFSKGEDFQTEVPVVLPPGDIFSASLRTLTAFTEKGASGKNPVTGWSYPFVVDSGEFCVVVLEMNHGHPPDVWPESLHRSIFLMKALVARQERGREDVTLTTRDPSGSLDYRATMNRLLEEWARTKKLGIPFSVIAIKIENEADLKKYYGAETMDLAWSHLVSLLKSVLRPTDWVMRPDKDLLLIQLLEAGYAQGLIIQKRIAKALTETGLQKSVEKPMHYRMIVVSHPVDASIKVTTFFDQILRRFDDRADFEGDYPFK